MHRKWPLKVKQQFDRPLSCALKHRQGCVRPPGLVFPTSLEEGRVPEAATISCEQMDISPLVHHSEDMNCLDGGTVLQDFSATLVLTFCAR